jgi:3-demethoxyubiquinol 3-hydroxylase
MNPPLQRLTPLDRIISIIDHGLKSSSSHPLASGRPVPQPTSTQPGGLSARARRHAAGLMRVNHAGEVAAQALYHGQALVARDDAVRAFLIESAREEGDHLAWCHERLSQLGARPSVLGPLWYAGSVAIGTLAGLAGDATSLGFIAETERQVEGHIDAHLARLPAEDEASRAILLQMKDDEGSHRTHALERGGQALPSPVRALMGLVSKVMTTSAYWI